MANMFEMVKEFMMSMDQEMGDDIKFRAELLRIRLVTEEANETAQAIYAHDMVKVVDGLCDLLYVTIGTFVAFGFTSEQVALFFAEVHRSNMEKTGGGLDAFGKVQKPTGWTPPNIADMLKEMTSDYYVQIIQDGDEFFSGPHSLEYCNNMVKEPPSWFREQSYISIKRRQKKIV